YPEGAPDVERPHGNAARELELAEEQPRDQEPAEDEKHRDAEIAGHRHTGVVGDDQPHRHGAKPIEGREVRSCENRADVGAAHTSAGSRVPAFSMRTALTLKA